MIYLRCSLAFISLSRTRYELDTRFNLLWCVSTSQCVVCASVAERMDTFP